MSFDEEPDDDPHGLCRHEIQTLRAENAKLRADYEHVKAAHNEMFDTAAMLMARATELGKENAALRQLVEESYREEFGDIQSPGPRLK